MKIQITGLPGTGKTTHIKQFLKEHPHVQYLDICNFTGRYREREFKYAILNCTKPVVAESACGVRNVGHIVRLQTPIETVFQRLLERDGYLDEEYLSLLGTQMATAHCTLSKPENLPGYLTTTLRSYEYATHQKSRSPTGNCR